MDNLKLKTNHVNHQGHDHIDIKFLEIIVDLIMKLLMQLKYYFLHF